MSRVLVALKGRVASDDGYVMVVVMVLLMIALALGTAALAESLDSATFNNRQARQMRAQQATDAGIASTLYDQDETNIDNWNLNGGLLGLGATLDCVVPTLSVSLQITGLASADVNNGQACPQYSGATGGAGYAEPLGNHTYQETEFFPGATNLLNGTTTNGGQNGSYEREFFPVVLSLGWDTNGSSSSSNWVYSRQEAILAPIAPLQAVEGMNNVQINGLQVCIVILGCANLAGTLNGDVVARNDLTTPDVFVGLNTTLSNGLFGTLAYGGDLHGGLDVANVQHTSPSNIIQRPAPIISSTVDCSVAADCTALGSAYSSTYHTFSLTSGSATFASGNYYFCSFNAASGTTINVNPTSSAPVRIMIRSPNDPNCAGDKSHGDSYLGDFNDPAGFTNQLLGTGGVLASSGFQVYVEGDGAYDDNTSVQIGPTSTSGLLSLSALTYGAVVYAPTSKLTVNVPAACVSLLVSACTGGVLEGAFIGNDVNITALTITQDLDLGNYPLYDGIQTFRPIEYIQCSDSLHTLTGTLTTDSAGC